MGGESGAEAASGKTAGSPAQVRWTEDDGRERSARWRSERAAPPPASVVVADDRMRADEAYRLATQGVGLLWRGDFHNARQLLTALAHRVDRRAGERARGGHGRRGGRGQAGGDAPRDDRDAATRDADASRPLADAFHRERLARAQRARTLGMLLVPMDADRGIPLRRAPDLREACAEAWGPPDGEPSVVALRELLGVVGAHEWRRRGVPIAALGDRVHPHYGVFSPTRAEYVELVARAPLPAAATAAGGVAFDVGTGTGVLAAVLARRGVPRVVATDDDPRALACARENVDRLGLADRVEVVRADLFPEGRAALVACNPPWVPGKPSTPLEHGIYDPDGRMLRGFLAGLAARLAPGGEGWLILSDFAERLGLRSRDALLATIDAAGLAVVDRLDARPAHPRASDASDPLHAARAAEVTSLWRLAAR